jgi:hypothetical protein
MLRSSTTIFSIVLRRNCSSLPDSSILFRRTDLISALRGNSFRNQIRSVATAVKSFQVAAPSLRKKEYLKSHEREKKPIRVNKELTIEEYMKKLKYFHEKQSFQGFRTLLRNLGSNQILLTQLTKDQKVSILSMIETIAPSLKGESTTSALQFMANSKYPVEDLNVQKTINALMLSILKDKKFPLVSLPSLLVGLTKMEWQLERLKSINYQKDDFIQFLTRILDQQNNISIGAIKDKDIVTIIFQLSKLGISKEDLPLTTQEKLLSLAKSAFNVKTEPSIPTATSVLTSSTSAYIHDYGRQFSNLIYGLGAINFNVNDLTAITNDESKQILIKSLENHLPKMSLLQISMILYGYDFSIIFTALVFSYHFPSYVSVFFPLFPLSTLSLFSSSS